MRTQRQNTGARAEDTAALFLEALGYRVVERNFRAKTGEIDLIVRDGESVVFVEVRARARSDFGSAGETVGWRKRGRLVRTARLYALARGLDCPMRFDVVAVDAGRLRHYPGAFDAGG